LIGQFRNGNSFYNIIPLNGGNLMRNIG